MKTVKQCKERVGALVDRVKAISDLAKAEKRDSTPEEKAELNRVLGCGKPTDSDYQLGELPAAEADLVLAEKVEAAEARFVSARGAAAPTVTAGEPEAKRDDTAIRASRIAIPARARVHGSLKSFKGAFADERAYTSGRFVLATMFGDDRSLTWCRDNGIDTSFRAALGENGNDLGGFLVPEEMETTIIELREKYGVFRANAKRIPMNGDTKSIPRRSTGLTASFGGENSTLTESEKTWDQVKLVAKKLYCLTRYSNELNEDAIINIGDDLADEIAYAFSVKEDQCGFAGDGSSTYGNIVGVVSALKAGSQVTAASGHTAFSTLTFKDYEQVVGTLPNYVLNPKWYISALGYATSMLSLMDAGGGNTIPIYQAGDGGRVGPMRMFMGYEVVITQALNKTAGADVSQTKVLFGDLAMAAVLGDRRGLAIAQSKDRYFELDQIGIRGVERFDINVHETGTATAAGAMVSLLTPAS